MACSLVGKETHVTRSSHRISGEDLPESWSEDVTVERRAPVQSQCSVVLTATVKIVRLKAREREESSVGRG